MKTTKIIRIQAREKTRENAYVTVQVLKIFLREIATEAIEYSVLNRIDGYQTDALQTFILILEGEGLETFIKEWLGTVLWIGKAVVSRIKKSCRLKVDVSIMDIELVRELDTSGVLFQYIRSRGAGGQHVNKVSTAVRATCPKTGLSVKVDESRSQRHNKQIAISRLREKINQFYLQKLMKLEQQDKQPTTISEAKPVRILRGDCLVRNTKQKSYKKKRNQLKKELRNGKFE